MEILVCIKRVPTVGGRIAVTPDGQEVDTRASGFSIRASATPLFDPENARIRS